MGFVRHGGRVAWGLIGALVFVLVSSTVLLANTADVRYQRDVTRMVFNDNLQLLEDVRRRVGAVNDSIDTVLAETPNVSDDQGFLVVSIEERRLWYKKGDSVLFETRVAVGSGKTLVRGTNQWKFDTPRGRLVVQRKDLDPAWVPPDWHFIEQARNRGLGTMSLNRGQSIPMADGSEITVVGSDVVRRAPDGNITALEAQDGREIVANGNIVIPPFGTNQRKYDGVLGTHRLYLGDGYALHGTNQPSSIGRAVSHGCIRLRNEDIETLYHMVPLGTPVYIY
ncbi:MAG TPA: L,D-transpeptidase [Gemmatimonadaceae bacterium]|nr:L,D-transpeptidase [Gemmatimonadaceae bacterium]